MPQDVKEKWYENDYHIMYWGEIVETLVRK